MSGETLGDYESDLRCGYDEHPSQPVPLEDVAAIEIGWSDDDDEPSFCWLLRLRDGCYATADGWTDYTGWGCRDGFDVKGPFATREDAIRLGLTLNERELLGVLLPGEAVDARPESP